MKSTVKKISGSFYEVSLSPDTTAEKDLLNESNLDTDVIELYYHAAVRQHLGPDANFLEVEDASKWPKAAIVKVGFSRGMGR